MAKRKRGTTPRPAGRPPGRTASGASGAPRSSRPARRRRSPVRAPRPPAPASPKGAAAPPRRSRATATATRPAARPATPASRVVQESTGRGAAQPGGRRTVELFARALSDESVAPTLPSSLALEPRPSAARTGRAALAEQRREHHETDPGMTAGDIDADWQAAYSVGDEAPGGDNPTPDQVVVDDVGRALGVEYDDTEELQASEKIERRDRHRWELDPASAEDYPERTKGRRRAKR